MQLVVFSLHNKLKTHYETNHLDNSQFSFQVFNPRLNHFLFNAKNLSNYQFNILKLRVEKRMKNRFLFYKSQFLFFDYDTLFI